MVRYERLVEDTPAHYISAKDASYGVYDYDTGIPLPEVSRIVLRYLKGRILFVLKYSPYNRINETYDGRHGKFTTCAAFRQYVDQLAKDYKRYYSAIEQVAQEQRSSIRDVDDFILEHMEFISDPFCASKQDKGISLEEVNKLLNEEKFVKNQIGLWSFSEQLIGANNTANSAARFFFVVRYSRCTDVFNNKKRLYLCNDGGIRNFISPNVDQCFFVSDRMSAVRIKKLIQNEINTRIEDAGYETTGDCEKWVSIEIRKSGTPTHLFTKQELAEIMRSADDRVNNQLVVDENGYAKLITSHEVGSLYAVYNECWCAGNNYVGKYSSLDTLECDYLHMLQGWLYYLQTGESQYAKYFDDEISAEILLSEILHFYNT